MKSDVLRINSKDNVAVALREIRAGEVISSFEGPDLKVKEDIPLHNKIAVDDIPEGAPVVKYGECIGLAGNAIRTGEWVHTHNLKSRED